MSSGPLVYLTRVYRLSAGHRLHHPERDGDWNRRVFGKCSFPDGHGHNYDVEVTLRGVPDGETGRVYPLELLDPQVTELVVAPMDHHHLNEVLELRHGPAPTTEVLAMEIWERLVDQIVPPAALDRIRVSETAKNTFEYRGPPPAR